MTRIADRGVEFKRVSSSPSLIVNSPSKQARTERDEGAIDSALARPAHPATYCSPDIADLAAVYIHGPADTHAFIDGNKRTPWVAGHLLLADNGAQLKSTRSTPSA